MDEVGALLRLFPFNPLAAVVIAGAFGWPVLGGGRPKAKRRALAVAALLWLLYAAWELYMISWRSPTGDRAIRVDMLFVAPALVIVSIAGWRAARRG